MNNPIDIYVVSGFLGSGKTTFMTQFLDTFSEKKVGVLINELGTVSIDGILIERHGIQMTEITNGSIYCYCKQGDFIQVLKTFSVSDIDVLLIENSGMADPSNIHGLLKQGEEIGGRAYHYRGAVCVLDAMTFLHHVEVLPSVENQVRCSNFIILNKIDMVNEVQLEKCRERISKINVQAHIIETMYAKVQFIDLEQNLVDNGYEGETTNKCYNKFRSYSIECGENIAKEQIEVFAEEVKYKLYRMKGFVKNAEGWTQIETIGEHMVIKEAIFSRKQSMTKSKIVVIGKDEAEFKEWLGEMWQKSIGIPFAIYD